MITSHWGETSLIRPSPDQYPIRWCPFGLPADLVKRDRSHRGWRRIPDGSKHPFINVRRAGFCRAAQRVCIREGVRLSLGRLCTTRARPRSAGDTTCRRACAIYAFEAGVLFFQLVSVGSFRNRSTASAVPPQSLLSVGSSVELAGGTRIQAGKDVPWRNHAVVQVQRRLVQRIAKPLRQLLGQRLHIAVLLHRMRIEIASQHKRLRANPVWCRFRAFPTSSTPSRPRWCSRSRSSSSRSPACRRPSLPSAAA